ncbi:MAG: helix-turn-helix transcriptional regulator [Lachnospiraceae bacterium]|nr:helix-turn-helix transcriptional regulator [Lachnospiraceae bacterium]
MDHQKFAQCVKESRTEKGMTQKELAARLHISDKAVSKWERALSFPDIELLGPLSQELDIPLSVLLDVEELTVIAGDTGEQGFETLLAELLAIMKERVQEEFYRKKRALRILTIMLTVLILLAAATAAWSTYSNMKQMKIYKESIHIFSEEDIEIISVEEKNNTIFLDLRIRDEAASRYDILERHWYDKEDPTIACVQFYCYEKEYLSFDSMESYAGHRAQNENQDSDLRKLYVETVSQQYKQDQMDGYTGFVSSLAVENDLLGRDPGLPVSKIVYTSNESDPNRHKLLLWEKSAN